MQLLSELSIETIRPIVDAALAALRQGLTTGTLDQMLMSLLIGVQAKRAVEAAQPALGGLTERYAATQILEEAIEQVTEINPLQGQILYGGYIEGLSDSQIANRHNYSRQRMQRMRSDGRQTLAEVLLAREEEARRRFFFEQTATLPVLPTTELVGRAQAVDELTAALVEKETPRLVCLTGIGGLGKTRLAQQVVRNVIPTMRFEQTVWLTVGGSTNTPYQLPARATFAVFVRALAEAVGITSADELAVADCLLALKQLLQRVSYLIVIDNLEIEAQTAYLLTHIYELTQPTKFLITSRTLPPQSLVRNYPLAPLTRADSIVLTRSLMLNNGQLKTSALDDETLGQVYDLIGGHPLGLQLVANLASTRALGKVLADLKQTQSATGDVLDRVYTRYLQQLSPAGLRLLHAMTLVAQPGSSEAHVQAIAGFEDEDTFWREIGQLNSLSLLVMEATSAETMRYSVHSLTNFYVLQPVERGEQMAEDMHRSLVIANLRYWQQLGPDMTAQAYRVQRAQLIRAVQFGLADSVQGQAEIVLATGELLDKLDASIRESNLLEDWILLFQRALELWPSENLSLRLRITSTLGTFFEQENRMDEAMQLHHEVERLARENNDELALSRVHYMLATDYMRQREYKKSREYALMAVQSLEAQGMSSAYLAPAYTSLAYKSWTLGKYDVAEVEIEKALALYRQTEDKAGLMTATVTQGYIYVNLRAYEQAATCMAQGTAMAEAIDSAHGRLSAVLGYAYLFIRSERYEEAEAVLLEFSAENDVESQAGAQNKFFHYYLAQSQALQQVQRAVPTLKKAMKLSADVGDDYLVGKCHGLLGLLEENCEAAAKHFDCAIELLSQYVDKELGAQALIDKYSAELKALEELR